MENNATSIELATVLNNSSKAECPGTSVAVGGRTSERAGRDV
jgi:hypothetical protein